MKTRNVFASNSIQWKFKDTDPIVETDSFWYLLCEGGYIKPENLLTDQDQIDKVMEAKNVLCSFEKAMRDNNLLEEC